MTIGARREQRQDLNPGHTPLDDDKNVRAKSPQAHFANKTGRKEVQADPNLGPGCYSHTCEKSKQMTIGVKREDKLNANPGHTPLDDDKNLRARSPETQFGNKSCRMES